MEIRLQEITDFSATIAWEPEDGAEGYRVYWADNDTPSMEFRRLAETEDCSYTLHRATHVPHYLKVSCVKDGVEGECSRVLRTPVKKVFHEQLEQLNRGLVAVPVKNGIFLSWRLFLGEVSGYCDTGMTGTDFYVYRNGERIAQVGTSTNYLDSAGSAGDGYAVAPVKDGCEGARRTL